MKQNIQTPNAPAAIGPYVQAVSTGGFLFLSGQIALDPQTGELISGEIEAQTRRVLENLRAVLEAAGSSLERVVKTTVYLADLSDFSRMNEVYGRFFEQSKPARSTVQAARLPRDARIEIDAIALV